MSSHVLETYRVLYTRLFTCKWSNVNEWVIYSLVCRTWFVRWHIYIYMYTHTGKACWWWDFDPIHTLSVHLYHQLRTQCYFGFVPQRVSRGRYPLVSSGRVRHAMNSRKLFVPCIYIHIQASSWRMCTCKDLTNRYLVPMMHSSWHMYVYSSWQSSWQCVRTKI